MNIHLSCKAVVTLEILVISTAAFSLSESSSFCLVLVTLLSCPLDNQWFSLVDAYHLLVSWIMICLVQVFCSIMISALRYLLGYDQAVEEEDEDDLSSDDEDDASKPGGGAAVSKEAVYKVNVLT